MLLPKPIRRLPQMMIAFVMMLSFSVTSYGQGNPPEDVQQDLAALLTQYNEVQRMHLEASKKMGPKHPEVKRLQSWMSQTADTIRKARQENNLLSANEVHGKIQSLIQELTDTIEQLKPLLNEEKGLDDAVAQFRKIMAELDTKKTMRNIFSEESIRRAQEDSKLMDELNSAMQSMLQVHEQTEKSNQAQEQAIKNASMFYQNMAAESKASYADIVKQLEVAKRLADMEYAQKFKADNQLQIEEGRALIDQAVKSAISSLHSSSEKQSSHTLERLDRLESEMGEVKDLLKQISSQLKDRD